MRLRQSLRILTDLILATQMSRKQNRAEVMLHSDVKCSLAFPHIPFLYYSNSLPYIQINLILLIQFY
jgi:hypothetical protein